MRYLIPDIETCRLRFRLLEHQDFDDRVDLFRNPVALRFLAPSGETDPVKLCQDWFNRIYSTL
jgi:hypothetical protein